MPPLLHQEEAAAHGKHIGPNHHQIVVPQSTSTHHHPPPPSPPQTPTYQGQHIEYGSLGYERLYTKRKQLLRLAGEQLLSSPLCLTPGVLDDLKERGSPFREAKMRVRVTEFDVAVML